MKNYKVLSRFSNKEVSAKECGFDSFEVEENSDGTLEVVGIKNGIAYAMGDRLKAKINK